MGDELVIATPVFRQIEADCLVHIDVETGAALVGRRIGRAIVAAFTICGGPAARRARSCFSPDHDWQQAYLDYLVERFDVNYIGDWHRHPGTFDRPSARDFETARTIVQAPEWDIAEAVFPIATISAGQVRLRAYLLRRDSADFEEIPIKVVEDSSRQVRPVLLIERNRKDTNGQTGRCAPCRIEACSQRGGFAQRAFARLWPRPDR